jgi:hypothetical protein
METPVRTSKSTWIVLLTVALAASILGFTLSYQDEQTRFSEMGSLAELHLIYALQLKDDMALIDWSKGLEKLRSVLTFQARVDSKLVAEGGNQLMCPSVSVDGLSFHFPYQWMVHYSFHKDSATSGDLTVVFQDFRGPLFWGIFLFAVTLTTGWIFIRWAVLQKSNQPSIASITAPKVKTEKMAKPMVPVMNKKSFTLALDHDYMISEVTPLAAQALNRQTTDLVGIHFLDLSPDPSVMKAIAEAKETKLLKPFPSHPHLSAFIRPVSEGTVLILETEEGP